jgi:hypothetical protein
MDADPLTLNIESNLLDLQEMTSSGLEFLSILWNAAEAMASPDLEIRRSGLERLAEIDAARSSPLVVYVLATHLTEPDLSLRSRIVKVLADVLRPDGRSLHAPEAVQTRLIGYLAQMRTRQIYALLQVVEFDPPTEPLVARLLATSSFAGEHLGGILCNRQMPLPIRRRAVQFVERIGYLDAIPCLERLVGRLEARKNGKNGTGDLNPMDGDEASLLLLAQNALATLRAP